MEFDFETPPLDWRVCRIPKPKKPGEFRKITIPNDRLKDVQRSILNYLYSIKELRPSWFAHGFVPYRNTSTGVLLHDRNADVFLCMDVRDFFDNFPLEPIRRRMIRAGVPAWLAEKILVACSYEGTIPQGGPCSPCLTNIGMFETDLMLSSFARRRGWHYSRYADDITLSTTFDVDGTWPLDSYNHIFEGVNKLLEETLGLQLKFAKNHVIRKTGMAKRQVTGVVIRKDGLGYNAPRKMRLTARAMVCNLAHKLERQHMRAWRTDKATWMKAKGYVAYMDMLRSYSDPEVAGADPVIQPKYWDICLRVFDKGGRKHGD